MKLATLCYIQKDGKTLMIHRVGKEKQTKGDDMHKGKWNGLGGKIEGGETPEECAIREIKEECGLTARNPKLSGILTFPGQGRLPEDWYVLVYVIKEFEGTLKDSTEGHLEWIPDEELLTLKLNEGDKFFLPHVNDTKIFSGRFNYDIDKLVGHSIIFH